MFQQAMLTIADTITLEGTLELVRVVWMEISIACFAAIVYFSMVGWFAPKGKTFSKPSKMCDDSTKGQHQIFPRDSASTAESQLVNKALRQGKISDAIATLRSHPKLVAGCLPANIAPRLLMAVAKASHFNDVMIEMNDFAGKIEARSLEAVVTEALKNQDVEACRRLHVMSGLLSICMTCQTREALAKAYGSDLASLRALVDETSAPLSKSFAKLVLEACTKMKDTDLAAEVFEKVADCDTTMLRKVVEKAATCSSGSDADAGGKDTAVHAKEIRARGKSGDLESAFRIFDAQVATNSSPMLCNAILEACVTCDDLDRALQIFSKAKLDGLADVVSYNIAMKGHVSQGNVAAAKSLLLEMSNCGLRPTHSSFHSILNFLSSAGDRVAVWKLIEEMQAADISPNSVTCSILLKGKLNLPSDVDKVFSIISNLEEPLDEVLFSTLAEACIRTKKLDVLDKYICTFTGNGASMVLSAPTYGSLIKAFGQMRDVKRVKGLWADMVKHGVQPTAITLGCMVEALVMNKCTADAWALVQDVQKRESTAPLVNTIIYSTILKGFAYAKDIDKVMALYKEMQASEIQANTITYNTILNAFAQNGAMHRVAAILEDMKAASPPVEPDIVTYSTLIKGFCNSSNLDRALCILKDMQSEGKIIPDEVMYNSLLDGCAKEHRLDDALVLFRDMKTSDVQPSNYTLSILVKLMGRCRRLKQAFSLVEEVSKEFHVKINIQVYTCLIQACFHNRQASKAIALHDQMIEEGLFPDEMTYSALVRGCLQASLVDKAVHIAKCAYGVALPHAHKNIAGINDRCWDELVCALGGRQSEKTKSLLLEIDQKPRGDGNRTKSSNGMGAPWRQRSD
jgi:pentatricopeptide repeat protein